MKHSFISQNHSNVNEVGWANFKTKIVNAMAIIASPNVSNLCLSI